jgi:hypothetical protein
MAKLLKSKPIQPLYTRGGTPIVDGFDPLGPGVPTNTPFPTEVQNPNQLEPSQMRGAAGTVGIGRGRGNAGPARTGAFGYGIRSRSFEQYNAPITDPRSQEPGAPISNRPIVPIDPGNPGGGAGANFNRPRPGGSAGPAPRTPNVRDISTPAPASGMQATSLGRPLTNVGVRGASVSKSTVSSARPAVAPSTTAASSAAKNAVATKPAAKKGSKTRLSRSMA